MPKFKEDMAGGDREGKREQREGENKFKMKGKCHLKAK